MRTALIIDDNSDIRALLRQALEMEGYQVLQAENGAIAQKVLQEGARPCVLILDLMMPVMDGREFLKWKNQNSDCADIPVVVISATPANPNLTGTCAYLRKPIDLDQMFELVADCCG